MARPIPEIPGVAIEHRYVEARGVRFHVAVAGPADADPLVLIHGWPEHWYAWRKLIGPLAERYRVYAPDLRGFGWSDAPRGSYLKAELAADMLALLDALGLGRVRLAGHDWGGFVGFLICLDAPERVSHYAAAGIPHPWVRPEPGVLAKLRTASRLAYQVVISSPGLGKTLVQRVPAFIRTLIRLGAADPDAAWTEEELERFVAQWREPDRAAACVSLYRTFLTKELKPLAAGEYRERTMQTPAILFAGGQDRVVQPENLGGFEANAPNMRLEVVAESGHWLPEEAPEALLGPMLELFEGPAAP
jgi:pimeloyl-ACP methyl ester carboxylesterase